MEIKQCNENFLKLVQHLYSHFWKLSTHFGDVGQMDHPSCRNSHSFLILVYFPIGPLLLLIASHFYAAPDTFFFTPSPDKNVTLPSSLYHTFCINLATPFLLLQIQRSPEHLNSKYTPLLPIFKETPYYELCLYLLRPWFDRQFKHSFIISLS